MSVLSDIGEQVAMAAVRKRARETGRTRAEQVARMGDHFAYQAAEQNPGQRQLDDYHGGSA